MRIASKPLAAACLGLTCAAIADQPVAPIDQMTCAELLITDTRAHSLALQYTFNYAPDGALPPAMRVGDEVSYVASITTRKSWLPWRSGQEIQRGTAFIGWSLLAERGEHGLSWTLMRTDIEPISIHHGLTSIDGLNISAAQLQLDGPAAVLGPYRVQLLANSVSCAPAAIRSSEI